MVLKAIFPGKNQHFRRESASNSRQNGSLSPDRTDEECRQNGRRSDCLISSPGKVPLIREIWFTFPDRTNEECRQNDRRSDCPISSPGKVPLIHGNLVHFPLIGRTRTRNAGRMAAEADWLISSRGKCRRFVVNWFTFPERTDEECRQNGRRSDCLISSRGKCRRFVVNWFTFRE